MEPTEPADTILRVLQENNGKRLDNRFNQKLQDATGDPHVRIVHQYGMVDIIWNEGHSSIVIAYTDGCPTIDAAKIKENNPAYFDARDKRNAERQELLTENPNGTYKYGTLFLRIASTINRFISAEADLRSMLAEDQLQIIEYSLKGLTE
jgi:phage FluMu gp28-like protein